MNFFVDNILRNPPILLGLVAALGLILQRKSVGEIVKGSALTAVGMVIMIEGTGIVVGSIAPIDEAFTKLSGGVISEGLDGATFITEFGGYIGLAMLVGLILHVIIARFTPIKSIFLTGHMLFDFTFIFIAAGIESGLRDTPLIVVAGILAALYWSIMPWLLRKYVWAVTGDQSFTLGHPTGILSLVAGFVSSKVGNKSKSTEDLNVPKQLSFLREVSITGGIAVAIMFVIIGLLIPSMVEGTNLFNLSVGQGLAFGAGLLVMLQGVRMLIGQILPAFRGISEKLIPNALPAFDCPIIFNYRPNAVLIGFIVAMITSSILIVIANANNIFGILLIPLVVTSFFECGTAAVIAEGQGGLRGCIIGTTVAAVLMVILVGISAGMFTTTIQNWLLLFGGNDLSLFGIIGRGVSSIFGGIL